MCFGGGGGGGGGGCCLHISSEAKSQNLRFYVL